MRTVAFDTETRGLDAWDPAQQACLATWADESGEYCADLSDPAQVSQFIQALKSADVIVAHNLSFDVHQVRETLGFDILELDAVLHDTDIMSRVLFPTGQQLGAHSLKNLAKVWLRADADAPEQDIERMAKAIGYRTIKTTGAYYDVYRAHPDVMRTYALADARYTYDLHKIFLQRINGSASILDLEHRVAPVLIRAEQRGIKVDLEAVYHLKVSFHDQLRKLRTYLEEELGEAALGGEGSDEALANALLGLGIPLTKQTSSGKLATDKFTLQPFAKQYPQIEALFEFRRLEKFLSTYLKPMDGRNVIHTSFRQCGAWTGRMSCMQPNMQNWPKRAGKEVRSVLVPRESHAFVVCDYDSIEIRLLAYYLNDPGFQQMIADGHDAHAWMAAQIWGGEVRDYAKGSPGEFKRSLAKQCLFAITYGAGAPRIAAMLLDAGMPASRDHAKSLISKIKASLPNYFHLNKRIRTKIESVGHVTTIAGRKNPVDKEKSYVGMNALIQGSAADIMKLGLVAVDDAVRPMGAIPLLVVHDEVVVETPVDRAEEVLKATQDALCSAVEISPRLAVSGSIVTTSYADA